VLVVPGTMILKWNETTLGNTRQWDSIKGRGGLEKKMLCPQVKTERTERNALPDRQGGGGKGGLYPGDEVALGT